MTKGMMSNGELERPEYIPLVARPIRAVFVASQ